MARGYLFDHELTADLSLAPFSTVVSFDSIAIHSIGGGTVRYHILFETSYSIVLELVPKR